MRYILDDDGRTVRHFFGDEMAWWRWMNQHEALCRVGLDARGGTSATGGDYVSTTFIGYSTEKAYRALLLETLVKVNGRWIDEYERRHGTRDEAAAYHAEVVQRVFGPAAPTVRRGITLEGKP